MQVSSARARSNHSLQRRPDANVQSGEVQNREAEKAKEVKRTSAEELFPDQFSPAGKDAAGAYDGALRPAASARQSMAAADVKRGITQSMQDARCSMGSSQAGSAGMAFDEFAAKFDREKMQKDIKDKKVASSTGVNHSATTDGQTNVSTSDSKGKGVA